MRNEAEPLVAWGKRWCVTMRKRNSVFQRSSAFHCFCLKRRRTPITALWNFSRFRFDPHYIRTKPWNRFGRHLNWMVCTTWSDRLNHVTRSHGTRVICALLERVNDCRRFSVGQAALQGQISSCLILGFIFRCPITAITVAVTAFTSVPFETLWRN